MMIKTKLPFVALFTALFLLSVWNTSVVFAQTPPDPGLAGSLAVTREEYNFGDTAFTPTNFPEPIELRASVHSPTNLSGGPFPLAIFLHGRHVTCWDPSTLVVSANWPCQGIEVSIPSYTGYNYTAQNLASHGFIVVSISANGINANDGALSDGGALARAELIQEHLTILRTFNTTGGAPFGTKFVGKINLNNVGTMGHSRGGDGVVRHFLLNKAQGSPFGIKAVFPLAATNFNRNVINRVPLGVMLPYCDGDVATLEGVHYYDDARYNVPGDTAPKHTLVDLGANHNFYNTVWTPGLFPAGTADDWNEFIPEGPNDPHCAVVASGKRSTHTQQRQTLNAYLLAFFRIYQRGQTQFLPFLTAAASSPPPSALVKNVFPAYHAPDLSSKRRDVNRLLTDSNLTINTLGGAVTQTNLINFALCGGEAPQPPICLAENDAVFNAFGTQVSEPHAAQNGVLGASQLRTNWYNGGSGPISRLQNDLPVGLRNVSSFQALQFRASVNYEGSGPAVNPVNQPQNFTVVLTDGAGLSSSVIVSSVSRALYYPPGMTRPLFGGVVVPVVPKILLNTVRIPMSSFSGVNLSDIRSVRFNFDRIPNGALLINDIAFASQP